MSPMQKSQTQPNSNFLVLQNNAKKLLEKEIAEKVKQAQEVAKLFENVDSEKLFKIQTTTLHENTFSNADVDFIYRPLDLEYLKSQGIELHVANSSGRPMVSSSCTEMQYVEYYLDDENSYIIFVKYHFSHIKIPFENGKKSFNTFVFVNTKSEIFYYDAFSGVKLLSTFKTGMTAYDAELIFRDKKFEISPNSERTYRLKVSENGEDFKEIQMKDLNLVAKQLFDILANQYQNDVIPSSSELVVETKFIGETKEPITVKSQVKISYRYSEVIETTEKLLEYEITMYFSNYPDKKLIAILQITQAEKDNALVFTREHLKSAILEEAGADLEKRTISSLSYDYLYTEHVINQNPDDLRNFSVQNDIAKLFFKNIAINTSSYEHSKLQGTFQKMLLESYKISTKKFPKFCKCNQLKATTITSNNDKFYQTSVYSIVYQDSLYLVEVKASYEGYACCGPLYIVYLPILGISKIKVRIFKPVNSKEIDDFINGKYNEESRVVEDEMSYGFSSAKELNKIFPDFDISTGESPVSYKIMRESCKNIYKNILKCLKNPATSKSAFHISSYGRSGFGDGDDDGPINHIPISHNGLLYAYFLDDGYNSKMTINSSLQNDFESSKNYWSGENELLVINFEDGIVFHKASMHQLFEDSYFNRNRKNKFGHITSCLDQYDIFKICIDFLLEHQDEILSN